MVLKSTRNENIVVLGFQRKLKCLSDLLVSLKSINIQQEKEKYLREQNLKKSGTLDTAPVNKTSKIGKHETKSPAKSTPKVLKTFSKKSKKPKEEPLNIFSVFGDYKKIRQELLDRGWLDETDRGSQFRSKDGLTFVFSCKNFCPLNFSRGLFNQLSFGKRKNFFVKNGLYECFEDRSYANIHGFHLNCPVTYPIESSRDVTSFVYECFLNQCKCLIFLLAQAKEILLVNETNSNSIHWSAVSLAINLVKRDRQDVDKSDWDSLITKYDFEKLKLAYEKIKDKETVEIKCDSILEKSNFKNAIFEANGLILSKWDCKQNSRNMWIIKPFANCGGKGISVMDNLQGIVNRLSSAVTSENPCIVQKYIETPLLIYGSKFDIRQFMLIVTKPNCLEIWTHDLFYIRFSAQEYVVNNLHESVHLTNRSIQKQYLTASRNAAIPISNHWSHIDFKNHLSMKYENDEFVYDKIVAKMIENGIATLLSALDEIELCENRFCLYGLDFLVSEDFQVWLLEVNNHPGLTDPTEVTGPIFEQVQSDLIKVVVDRKLARAANTGGFQLQHLINGYKVNRFPNLQVNGRKILVS